MSRFNLCLLLWGTPGLLLPPATTRADDLAGKIDKVISAPHYQQAHWGILVVDARTGETLYAHHPDRLFAPASTTKLYSCATALCLLGPDHKFKTPIYRRGEVKDGRLDGDLILVAQGDLSFGGRTGKDGRLAFENSDHTYANGNTTATLTQTDPLAGLKSLARQIKESGIREVSGEVLIDDRLFERGRGSGSGPDLLTPIVVNDNVVDLIITPAKKAGEPATVQMRPETSFLHMDAQVKTVDRDKEISTFIETVGPGRFTVRGHVPVGAPPLVRVYYIEDPAGFARSLFIEVLRGEGVAVTASPLRSPQADLPEKDRYTSLPRIALFTSPPLSEVIKVTLKVSHNLYASTLPLLVAVKNDKKTLAEGLRLQGKFLAELGVDVKTISFAGGAGGMSADMVTPRATVQLLQAMTKRPEYQAFKEGLPILGGDGTLSDVVGKDSPARGKVWAKTGTLGWYDQLNGRLLLRSKALAGVMTTAKGRELAFAIFVNDVPLDKGKGATREGKTLGRICEILHQQAP